MKQLLIATTNKGKFEEFKAILSGLTFKLIYLRDLGFNKEPQETGQSFQENAVLKARFYGEKSKIITLADDSGLEVAALPNALGTRSKRYGSGSDKDRIAKLLKEMGSVPDGKRKARFISVVAFYNPENGKIISEKGICYGRISFKAKGRFGFGFDPVFIVEGLNKHFAELTLKEKNQVSHRAKALKKMLRYLKGL